MIQFEKPCAARRLGSSETHMYADTSTRYARCNVKNRASYQIPSTLSHTQAAVRALRIASVRRDTLRYVHDQHQTKFSHRRNLSDRTGKVETLSRLCLSSLNSSATLKGDVAEHARLFKSYTWQYLNDIVY